jgi:hypothetical protein
MVFLLIVSLLLNVGLFWFAVHHHHRTEDTVQLHLETPVKQPTWRQSDFAKLLFTRPKEIQ